MSGASLRRPAAILALAAAGVLSLALPASADPVGLRPLGGDFESARAIGAGKWVVEAGALVPMLSPVGELNTDDAAVFQRWQTLPAWPSVRGMYGLPDGNEAVVELGHVVTGGYRRHFLRADAPWPGEYLQAMIQLGGGFHLPAMRPMGYIRFPAIYERGAWTFHLGPGGYYLFNQQPVADVQIGTVVRQLEGLTLGGMARLRMDAKALTPTEGAWSFSGGARYQLGDRWTVQIEGSQDAGPPEIAATTPQPRIEFPMMQVRASVTYYHW